MKVVAEEIAVVALRCADSCMAGEVAPGWRAVDVPLPGGWRARRCRWVAGRVALAAIGLGPLESSTRVDLDSRRALDAGPWGEVAPACAEALALAVEAAWPLAMMSPERRAWYGLIAGDPPPLVMTPGCEQDRAIADSERWSRLTAALDRADELAGSEDGAVLARRLAWPLETVAESARRLRVSRQRVFGALGRLRAAGLGELLEAARDRTRAGGL